MIRGSPITFNVGGVSGKQTISVLKRDQGVVGEESKFEVRFYITHAHLLLSFAWGKFDHSKFHLQ